MRHPPARVDEPAGLQGGLLRFAPSIPRVGAAAGRRFFVFWHEYILFPVFLESLTSAAVLVSRHGDADALTHLVSHFHLKVIRGSTRRGGAAATLEMVRKGAAATWSSPPTAPAARAAAWRWGRCSWP